MDYIYKGDFVLIRIVEFIGLFAVLFCAMLWIMGCSEPDTNIFNPDKITVELTPEQIEELKPPGIAPITSDFGYSIHEVCDDWGRICLEWAQDKLKLSYYGYITNNTSDTNYEIAGISVFLYIPPYKATALGHSQWVPYTLDAGSKQWFSGKLWLEFDCDYCIADILVSSVLISYRIDYVKTIL